MPTTAQRMQRRLWRFLLGGSFFISYAVAGVVYFALASTVVDLEQSLFATIGLLTGEGPGSLPESFASEPLLLRLSWILHVMSWLFLPALVGVVVTKAVEREQRLDELEESLFWMFRDLGKSEEEARQDAPDAARKIVGNMSKLRSKKR